MEARANQVVDLDPKTIKVGWRARKDDGDIAELAESIQRIGQLQPIVVRKDKQDAPVIIAGLRRKRACQKLGIKVKAIFIDPADELANVTMQLEENVKRQNFDKLEVGEGLQRMKLLYEKKHGLAKGWHLKLERDAKGHVKKVKGDGSPQTFVAMTARSLGISESLVLELLGIAKLPEKDKKEIAKAKTPRERNVAANKALSKVRQANKEAKLEKEAAKKQKAKAKAKKAAKAKGEPVPEEKTIEVIEGDYRKAIKGSAFLKEYKGNIDLICTDPMYDLERNPILHSGRSSINEGSLAKWDRLDISWVLDVAPLMAQSGTFLAFTPLELIGLYKVACMRAKLTYRGAVIWHKTNPAPAHRSVYVPSCEAIVFATKGDKYAFKPWENAGTSAAHNFIDHPICGGNERLAHPFQKPLGLIQRLLERHTSKPSLSKTPLVFDPFMGTGTVLVAAAKMKLRAVGIELEPKYVKLAKTRLAAL